MPNATLFNGVLVKIKLNGETVYLNDTDQYAALGQTERDGCLGASLPRGRMRIIQAERDKKTRILLHNHIEIDEEGDARIVKRIYYYGSEFSRQNRKFSELPPEERRRYHLETLAQISQSAEAAGELLTDFDAYPGVESFAADVDRYAVREGDYIYFSLPDSLSSLMGLRAATRENPLYWPYPQRVKVVTTLDFPEGFDEVILKPKNLFWSPGKALGAATITEAAQIPEPARGDAEALHSDLVLIHDLSLNPLVLDACRYEELLDVNRKITHARSRTFLIKAKESQCGALKAASRPVCEQAP